MSPDAESRHRSFRESLNLPFPLLSDPDSEVAAAFGVTRMRGFLPSKRVSFVIDAGGTVRRAISAELDIAAHVRESLEALRKLG